MIAVLPLSAFLLAAGSNVILATLVVRRNPKSTTNKLFALLGLALSVWATVNYISFTIDHYSLALWTIRAVFAGAIIQSLLFALLLHTIPQSTLPLSTWQTAIIFTLMTAGVMVAFSPYLVTAISPQANLPPKPIFGIGLAAFIPIVLSSIVGGIVTLIRKNIRSVGLAKVQQRYVLTSLVITFGLLIAFILLRVLIWQDTSFVPYAPIFTLPFVGLTAYTIIRHRLMDIRGAILRGLSLSVLFGAILGIYSLLLILAVPLVADATGLRSELLAVAAALVTIPLARYIQGLLKRLTDRFLFQNRADYRQALVTIGDALAGTIKIGDVTDTVLAAMRDIVRSRKTIIFLKDPASQELTPRAAAGARNFRVNIPSRHVLLQHLRHAAGPLVKDEVALIREQERSPRHIEELEEIENALTWLDAAVVLPLFVNKELTGVIALGDKLSGEPYLQDDTNFLAALAPQAATALENARLYLESQEFGEKLKVEVERATHELSIANEQLKDIDKAKSEFLSIASHQLYTPLTALRGYLSMILEGTYGKAAPKQQPIIGILEQSAHRLINLIRNLLDISRIESGRLELDLVSLDLAELTRELIRELLPNARKKDLALRFVKPTQPLPHVAADRERLRQVMLNFIDNALKYTTAGRIDVTLRQVNDELVFAVTDTGKGLTAQEIAKLFNKFTRVGGAERLHTEGTGLGLYVAKQIVREHRGDVEVDSPGPNQGSTFSMRLPIENSPRALKVGEKTAVAIKAA